MMEMGFKSAIQVKIDIYKNIEDLLKPFYFCRLKNTIPEMLSVFLLSYT